MKNFKRLFSLALALVLAITPIVAQEAAECSAAIHFSGQTGSFDDPAEDYVNNDATGNGSLYNGDKDYPTFFVKITARGTDTAVVTVYVPEGVYCGKIAITTTEDLELIPNSVLAKKEAVKNENYQGGICVSFASATAYSRTNIFEARYKIKEGATVTLDDLCVFEWELFDCERKLASEEDGDVEIVYLDRIYKFGDVNGDNTVDALDAAILLQYDAGLITKSEFVFTSADINSNQVIDAFDASLLLSYDAGLTKLVL